MLGTLGQQIVCMMEEDKKISKKDQKIYQSAVGTLLYY